MASGRSVNTVMSLARQGLIPGYRGARRGIPEDLAGPAVLVLRGGAASPELARLIATDPSAAIATGEAVVTLARAELARRAAAGKGRAA